MRAWVNKKEVKILKTAFKIFLDKFNLIWRKEYKKFKKIQIGLEEKIKEPIYHKIIEDLINFYNSTELKKKYFIHLFLSSSSMGVAGTTIWGNLILECSGIKLNPHFNNLLTVFYHEFAHILQQEYFKNLLVKNVAKIQKPFFWPKNSFSNKELLREAATCAMVNKGVGYINQKYFQEKVEDISPKKFKIIKKEDFFAWPPYAAFKLNTLTKKYFEENKKIDQYYFNKIILVWNNYLKKFR